MRTMSDALATIKHNELTKSLQDLLMADTAWLASTGYLSQVLQSLDTLTPVETALLHEWLKKREEDIKAFHKVARERLEGILRAQGTKVTEKGALQISLGNGRVQRATPVKTTPDDRKTERTLKKVGIPPELGMYQDIKWKADESKLMALVAQGMLTEAQYKDCLPELTYRIGKTGVAGEEDED